MKLPENIRKTLEILTGNGFEAYVVGGCVRDMIMGKAPADYDITTNALPNQTAECFKDYRVIETGIKHGTVTVVMNDENVEITTYRVDGEYLDNRRPENVCFTSSIKEDLARRDFTMNAIAYNSEKGFVDPFFGEEDIKKGIIRCVGNADMRFNEDGLRILRALRFSSQTGFEIEEETSQAVIKNKNLIKNISSERIFTEFKKLLCGKTAHKVLNDYKDVIAVFLPEILPMVGFEQNTRYHHLDVFSHTLKALENSEADVLIRLAIFLHDIGKPEAFYADDEGTAHFKGHALIGANMARVILGRLKCDNETKNKVCSLIEMHSSEIDNVKRLVSEKGYEFAKLLVKVKKADASAKAPQFRSTPELDEAMRIIEKLENSGEPIFLSDLAVSGKNIVLLGAKGEKVGEILKKLLYAVHDGEVENRHDKLMKQAEEYLTNEKS